MRIFALPLTRVKPNRPALVFYLAQHPPKPKTKSEGRIAILRKRALVKLTDTWNGWGEKESGWQKRVYDFGQRAQARVEFEELALRSIDPALGPRLTSSGEGAKQVKALKGGHPLSTPSISLFYPSSFRTLVGQEPLSHLESHLAERGPKHKRKFWLYVFSAPFTAPFMVVPIIPNIPFFFVAWRAWSNYRAFKAAAYLQTIGEKKAIISTSSQVLDEIYAHSERALASPSSSSDPSIPQPTSSTPSTTSSSSNSPSSLKSNDIPSLTDDVLPTIVLSERSMPLLESTNPSNTASLEPPLSHENISEIVRAIRQVRARIGLEKEVLAAKSSSSSVAKEEVQNKAE